VTRNVFLRGVDETLYTEMTRIAAAEGVPLVTLIESIAREWLEADRGGLHRHVLLLYSDRQSLLDKLRALNGQTKKGWFRAFILPGSPFAWPYLSRNGWFHAKTDDYASFESPLDHFEAVWQRITREAKGQRTCVVGGLHELLLQKYATQKEFLRETVKVCDKYNSGKRIRGVMYCPVKVSDLTSGESEDFADLLKNHDIVHLLAGQRSYSIQLTDESLRLS
jgi:hypothetical protein